MKRPVRPQTMRLTVVFKNIQGCLNLRTLANVSYHADIWRLSAAARVVPSGARRNLEYSLRLLRYAGIDLPEWRSVARS